MWTVIITIACKLSRRKYSKWLLSTGIITPKLCCHLPLVHPLWNNQHFNFCHNWNQVHNVLFPITYTNSKSKAQSFQIDVHLRRIQVAKEQATIIIIIVVCLLTQGKTTSSTRHWVVGPILLFSVAHPPSLVSANTCCWCCLHEQLLQRWERKKNRHFWATCSQGEKFLIQWRNRKTWYKSMYDHFSFKSICIRLFNMYWGTWSWCCVMFLKLSL